MSDAPFQVGDRVGPQKLLSWVYTGLSGKPGKDKDAVRRFKKGSWVLEVRAHENPARSSTVVSIRTSDADDLHWAETRQRQMRHRIR